MPKRSKDSPPERSGRRLSTRGRPFVDPGAKRVYRYVQRMHPDLAEALTMLAEESGLSRALFVERVLISFVNQDPRIRLNSVGRKIDPDEAVGRPPLGSLASFGRQWQRWQALRHDVIGEEERPGAYGSEQPQFDDGGRDEGSYRQRSEPRPQVPKHSVAPDFSSREQIRPHRGGKRTK